MKRRIFGKWIMLCLLAVLLAAAPAGKTAAEEKSSLEILLENAGLLAQDLDVEELREYYRQFESVIQSDEFQNLIEYEEVRDLITALVDKGVDFAIEDPDLAQKILITAGMDEKIVSLLPLLLEKGSKAGEALEAFKQSEEGKAILDSLNVSVDVDREALTKALLEFILGHYAKTDEPEAEAVYQALEDLLSETEADPAAETGTDKAAQTEADFPAETEADVAAETETDFAEETEDRFAVQTEAGAAR